MVGIGLTGILGLQLEGVQISRMLALPSTGKSACVRRRSRVDSRLRKLGLYYPSAIKAAGVNQKRES